MKELSQIVKHSINTKSSINNAYRLKELCSNLSIYSINAVFRGIHGKYKKKTRLDFITNLELNVPHEIVCSFLLFDALKIGLFSENNIKKFLMLSCNDIIITDRIVYFSKMLSNIESILHEKNQELISMKSLSILYELDLIYGLSSEHLDKNHLRSISNYIECVSPYAEDRFTELLKNKISK